MSDHSSSIPHLLTASQILAMPEYASGHALNPKALRYTKSLGDAVGLSRLGLHLVRVRPGKETTQFHLHHCEEEFFYTFNSLYNSRKQIVVASDRAPKEMAPLEQRLISRLEFGVVSDIKPPDLETRIAILRKKAEAERLSIPDDVTLYIATALKSNIRELEGALIRLTAFSSLTGVPLTVQVSREQLKDTVSMDESVNVRVETIQREVADQWAIDPKDMKSRSRRREVSFPRQIAMYLATQLTEMSTTQIGEAFGGRDHSTVVHARDKIRELIDKDPYFMEKINKTTEHIKTVDNQ